PGPLSAIRTSVYAFPGTLDTDGGIWQLARPNMDRGVPVRFRSDAGVECTFVYFVGPQLVRDLPVIHLTLNPNFLFDHDTGIYVLGATFDEWREGNYDPGMAFRTEGNYSQRGRDWERPFVNDLADSIVMHYFVDGGQAY